MERQKHFELENIPPGCTLALFMVVNAIFVIHVVDIKQC